MSIAEIVAALFFGAAFYTAVMYAIFKDLGKGPPGKP